MLATVHYQFIWATTLLTPDRFVTLASTLGVLPAWLGFHGPAADMVRSSNGSISLPATVQTQWSLWLMGVVLAYGLLPRLVALPLCATKITRALRQLRVDPLQPGLDTLRPRLLPDVTCLGNEGILPTIHQPRIDFSDETVENATPAHTS